MCQDNTSRFVESLKKKYVGQETESLQLRTGRSSGSSAPQVECLVATLLPGDDHTSDSSQALDDDELDELEEEEDSESSGRSQGGSSSPAPTTSRVVGCIDIKLSRAACGIHPAGVPEEDLQGCYLLNVVVEESLRGQGIGKDLMREAMKRAVHVWKAGAMYTHVEADNEQRPLFQQAPSAAPEASTSRSAPASPLPPAAQQPPNSAAPAPLDAVALSDEAARRLLQQEEGRRRKSKGKGRLRELEELELERKLRALLTKEKDRAEEEAALATGLCTGGGHAPLATPSVMSDLLFHVQSSIHLYSTQSLSNVVYSLALSAHAPSTGWLEAMHAQVCKKANSFTPQGLTQVYWALAKLQLVPTADQLQPLIRHAGSHLETDYKAIDCSTLLYVFARFRTPPPPALLSRLMVHMPALMPEMEPCQLANSIWALGSLRLDFPHEAGAVWYEMFWSSSFRHLHLFGPTDLAQTLWGCARLRLLPPSRWTNAVKERVELQSSRFSPTEVTETVWALARLGCPVSTDLLNKLFASSENRLSSFKPKELSAIIWSLAHVNRVPETKWSEEFMKATFHKMSMFEPQHQATRAHPERSKPGDGSGSGSEPAGGRSSHGPALSSNAARHLSGCRVAVWCFANDATASLQHANGSRREPPTSVALEVAVPPPSEMRLESVTWAARGIEIVRHTVLHHPHQSHWPTTATDHTDLQRWALPAVGGGSLLDVRDRAFRRLDCSPVHTSPTTTPPTPQGLGNMLLALSKLRLRPPPAWLYHYVKVSRAALPTLDALTLGQMIVGLRRLCDGMPLQKIDDFILDALDTLAGLEMGNGAYTTTQLGHFLGLTPHPSKVYASRQERLGELEVLVVELGGGGQVGDGSGGGGGKRHGIVSEVREALAVSPREPALAVAGGVRESAGGGESSSGNGGSGGDGSGSGGCSWEQELLASVRKLRSGRGRGGFGDGSSDGSSSRVSRGASSSSRAEEWGGSFSDDHSSSESGDSDGDSDSPAHTMRGGDSSAHSGPHPEHADADAHTPGEGSLAGLFPSQRPDASTPQGNPPFAQHQSSPGLQQSLQLNGSISLSSHEGESRPGEAGSSESSSSPMEGGTHSSSRSEASIGSSGSSSSGSAADESPSLPDSSLPRVRRGRVRSSTARALQEGAAPSTPPSSDAAQDANTAAPKSRARRPVRQVDQSTPTGGGSETAPTGSGSVPAAGGEQSRDQHAASATSPARVSTGQGRASAGTPGSTAQANLAPAVQAKQDRAQRQARLREAVMTMTSADRSARLSGKGGVVSVTAYE
ncbi:MAG: hypothetical protein WDW38_011227 [Sanguina aurantia]